MIEKWRTPPPACCQPPTGPPPVLLLAGEAQSARAAREFVHEYVSHHVPEVSQDHLDTVVLIACELVTNAIRYGTEPGDSLRIVIDADETGVRIEVHDPVRRRPRFRPESPHRNRGRGLLILNRLCPDGWGVDDIPMGKAVWAHYAFGTSSAGSAC
ncbi:ATP-binding protein [Streptomyces sp. NPDC050161]|uniref:ATP-binding protein n=1 Tax=Streptomyces sp. NPDC050161 TaxID=3365604 RepID=UPI0037BCB46B